MKKIFFFLLTVFVIVFTGIAQPFHQLSVKKLNGETVSLSTFKGKKVMLVIVPLNQQDSVYNQLTSFREKYKDTIQIIAILSVEDGFNNSILNTVSSIYSHSTVLLTEGMYTRKNSGENQSGLMKWLTDKNKNRHFDMDSRGIGHKFFVNESGRLYAVMPPQTSLDAPIIEKILKTPRAD